MNRVRVGFFSFTEITDAAEHRAYNEWHQLDHMPEQYPLPGLVAGQRWVASPRCRAAWAVAGDPLAAVHYVTLYLMGAPVEATLVDFLELGRRLHGLGRFHEHRRSHLSGPFQFMEAAAAPRVLISPEAVPHRPNRGIYVLVENLPADGGASLDAFVRRDHEEVVPTLLGVPGVAGVWSFATAAHLGRLGWSPGRRRITVCYLDDDPVAVSAALAPVVHDRWRDAPVEPVLAGSFEAITPWEWDWFDGAG
jgi:hypothetical protein